MKYKREITRTILLKTLLISILILPLTIILTTGCKKNTGSLDLFGDHIKSEKLDQVILNFSL